jgi:hypothetical protein
VRETLLSSHVLHVKYVAVVLKKYTPFTEVSGERDMALSFINSLARETRNFVLHQPNPQQSAPFIRIFYVVLQPTAVT